MGITDIAIMTLITLVAIDFGFRIIMYSKTKEYRYKHKYRWWKK